MSRNLHRPALLVGLSALLALCFPARAQSEQETLRPFVLKAVAGLHATRSRGGYDIGRRFTRDLHYGGDCCLKATRPLNPNGRNPTMCVAAVAEVIVEALNAYGQGDPSFKSKLPLSRWNGGTRTHVIPNLFMYAGSDSAGTAFTFKRLGLGREKPFAELLPGDFVNFNRLNRTGHAVVFLGFLRRGSTAPSDRFSADVVGFRYFSAQGQNRPDGGFGYRNAYLSGKCPTPRGRDDDCNIIGVSIRADGTVVQSQRLFNSGELFTPERWRTAEALAELRDMVSRAFEEEGLTRGSGLDEAVEAVLGQTLPPDPARFVDGSGD